MNKQLGGGHMNDVDEAIAVTKHLMCVLEVIKEGGDNQPERLLDLRKRIAVGCLENISNVLSGESLPEDLAQMLLRKRN
jgi:hypothetical protein